MRTIALKLDWDSTLFFFDAKGRDRIDEATLPISPDLKRQLDQYYKQYSDLYLLDDSPRKVDPLDKRLLDDTGLQIWQQLRAELAGSYDVIFYSFEFGEKFDDPQKFIATRSL
jgi:hypothetical protein